MVDLIALGLTQYENKAYETILKKGKGSAMDISKESGVPYGRIYDTLSSLQDKGLINLIPEKTKKFQVASIDNLKHMLKKKKDEIESISKQIESITINVEEQNKNPLFLTGKKNFKRLMAELEKPRIYEYNLKFSGDIYPDWISQKKENIKNGIDIKDIIRNVPETRENVKKWLKVHKNIREYNNNEGIVLTIIDDKIAIISSIKSTMITVLKEEMIIKLLKDMFISLYNNSPPLTLIGLLDKNKIFDEIKQTINDFEYKGEYQVIGIFGSFTNPQVQQINDIDIISIGNTTHHALLLKKLNHVIQRYGYNLKPFKTIKNIPPLKEDDLLVHDLHYSDIGEMYKLEWNTVINTIKKEVKILAGDKNFFSNIPFLKITEEEIILPLESWLYEIENKNKFDNYLKYLKKIIPKLLNEYPELNLGHLFKILSIEEKDWKLGVLKIKDIFKLKPVIPN